VIAPAGGCGLIAIVAMLGAVRHFAVSHQQINQMVSLSSRNGLLHGRDEADRSNQVGQFGIGICAK
jgi:hypothetical protein